MEIEKIDVERMLDFAIGSLAELTERFKGRTKGKRPARVETMELLLKLMRALRRTEPPIVPMTIYWTFFLHQEGWAHRVGDQLSKLIHELYGATAPPRPTRSLAESWKAYRKTSLAKHPNAREAAYYAGAMAALSQGISAADQDADMKLVLLALRSEVRDRVERSRRGDDRGDIA